MQNSGFDLNLTNRRTSRCGTPPGFRDQKFAEGAAAVADVVKAIPGRREGYFREADDDDSQDETGISKGIIVGFQFGGRTFQLYGLHLASEAGGADADEQRIAQALIIRRVTLPAINAGKWVRHHRRRSQRRTRPARAAPHPGL